MGQSGTRGVGAVGLLLVDGLALLHPEDAVFEAMLEGWKRQQFGGRHLDVRTVRRRQSVVRRFMSVTNEYPWAWTPAHLDEWMCDLVATSGLAGSTIRSYQGAIRMFCDYCT
ncbi:MULTISPECIES: hypothetical protein [unclassified Streptomyces]|uniref:hypothetical protein n=1 Tax=unclassified Streptomyces TaxID=2593676 RepID=UPI002E18A090|nr:MULTISPECIES: hypothetical protein [unclassified Streptomyces]